MPEVSSDPLRASNELFRTIAYGEALRAAATYLSSKLLEPPTAPTLDLLDDAYERMTRRRSTFSPEDFGLYVLSLILELAEAEAEEDAQRVRIGAARYLLDVTPCLAPDLQALAADARRILAEAGPEARPDGPLRHLVCLSDAPPPTLERRPPAALPAPPPQPERRMPPAETAPAPGPAPTPPGAPTLKKAPRIQDRLSAHRGRQKALLGSLGYLLGLGLAIGVLSALIVLTRTKPPL